MNEVAELIKRCRDLNVELTPVYDTLKLSGAKPLPDDLVAALIKSKSGVMAELRHQVHQEVERWMLEEWRKINLPAWRRILKESIQNNDRKREEYARYMLKDILEDQDYKEVQP
jgi:hypothetical protein